MLTVRDKPPSFEEVSSYVAKSVIAIAIGNTLDGKPNIVGTGFAVEWPECFATCWHVAEIENRLKELSKEELEKNFQLVDTKLRIARRIKEDVYTWQEIEEKLWFRIYDKKADICIYRAIGVLVPPLHLFRQEDFAWGSEVGVVGFPMGNLLQGKLIRPFCSKTIIAGGLELKLESGEEVGRLALDSAFASGFSGAPVFLANDGQVVGMITSKTFEWDESGQVWPTGISLATLPSEILRVLGAGMDKTTEMIKDSLRKTIGENR